LPNIRYEKFASAFDGFEGFCATNFEELDQALKTSLSIKDSPVIINVMIDPQADRKQQVINVYSVQKLTNFKFIFICKEFPWLTKSKI
jgi:2-hydroxyacyl-CoA lyase 1